MKLLSSVAEVLAFRGSLEGQVGFVPTMGALHEGHLSLVEASRAQTEHTIVSVYVNETQFNNANDLENYPDTLDEDLQQLERHGVTAVFLPDYATIYPDDFTYHLDEKAFSLELCGAHRPGHFTGVLTVVMKLLNIVKPDKAYFGEKDFQQLTLIRGMVDAFFMGVDVVGCPIVREEDGLAMSSRNLNLTPCDRLKAPAFSRIISRQASDQEVVLELEAAGFEVDYVQTLQGRRFAAVVMGNSENPVRLIDNVGVS